MNDTSLSNDDLNRALDIHKKLTSLVLEGGDFATLAYTLANLIGHSISIEDKDFQALANHDVGAVDAARQYTIDQKETNPALVAELENRGVLSTIRRERKPYRLPPIPEVGLEMERILNPIVVQGAIYGFFWIISSREEPLSDLDFLAIESGATVAALLMLRTRIEEDAQNKLKGDLITQLIKADSHTASSDLLVADAQRYGVDLVGEYVVLCVDNLPEGVRAYSLGREIAGILAEGRMVFGEYNRMLVGIVPAVEGIFSAIEGLNLTLGVASGQRTAPASAARLSVSAVARGVESVRGAYDQCVQTLLIATRLGMAGPTLRFDQLGYLHTLWLAGPGVVASNPYIPKLRALQHEVQADLLNTLEVYLDAGANGVQTADRLTVHRSTLNYRLQRIEDVCRVNLADPLERINLQVGIKLIRLFD